MATNPAVETIPSKAQDRVMTAGAYVLFDGRVVFAIGLAKAGADRLVIYRLGGHVEPAEAAWECAAREVREEAAVDARAVDPPATYWARPPHDPAALVAAPWRLEAGTGPAPLIVAWREEERQRRLSATYLARTERAPTPAAETQALLLLTSRHVRRLAREAMTLEALLNDGAELIQLEDVRLNPTLPLEPFFQLRALAVLLDRHADLLDTNVRRASSSERAK